MFSLLFTFCLHFYLINIHVFDYPDSQLSGLFAEVPKSPDNRGSTVFSRFRTGHNVQRCVIFRFPCHNGALSEKYHSRN